MKECYFELGISEKVYEFGEKIEQSLKEEFGKETHIGIHMEPQN